LIYEMTDSYSIIPNTVSGRIEITWWVSLNFLNRDNRSKIQTDPLPKINMLDI